MPDQGTTINEPRPAALAAGARRGLYLALAAVFFALAVLGALLPVLPTTPFLLLTSFLLVRSSPALNDRLLRSRTFGPMLQDWHQHRALRPHVKIASIVTSGTAVALTALFGNLSPWGLAALAALAATGLTVLIRLPVIRN
jgi:uncharacterized membrane protein YbaN (DUF454 family)